MLLFHGLFVRYICCCCQVDFGCSVDRNAAVPHFLFLQIDRCVAATVAVDLLGWYDHHDASATIVLMCLCWPLCCCYCPVVLTTVLLLLSCCADHCAAATVLLYWPLLCCYCPVVLTIVLLLLFCCADYCAAAIVRLWPLCCCYCCACAGHCAAAIVRLWPLCWCRRWSAEYWAGPRQDRQWRSGRTGHKQDDLIVKESRYSLPVNNFYFWINAFFFDVYEYKEKQSPASRICKNNFSKTIFETGPDHNNI